MSCLGAIFTCSIYDVVIKCYFGGVLTSPNQNIKIMSTTGELHGDVIGKCKVLSRMTLLLPKIVTSPTKVFSFRKVQEVSLCRILFIILVGLAYYLCFNVNTTKRCCTKYV